jgi:hypothetical protein
LQAAKTQDECEMIRVSGTSAVVAIIVTASFATAGLTACAQRSDLLSCAGMELAQSPGQGAEPKEDAPDASPGTQPDDGSDGPNSQSPGDNDDDDGAGSSSDQASPPDTAQPPGCIFHDAPLDLIV